MRENMRGNLRQHSKPTRSNSYEEEDTCVSNMSGNLGQHSKPTRSNSTDAFGIIRVTEVKCSTDPNFSPAFNPRPDPAVLMDAISVGEKTVGGDASSTKTTGVQSSWSSSRPQFRDPSKTKPQFKPQFRGPSDLSGLSGCFKSRTLLSAGERLCGCGRGCGCGCVYCIFIYM